MRRRIRLSTLLLGLWSLHAFSQEPPPPDMADQNIDTAPRGWDGRLPMAAPPPAAAAAGAPLYFDFSTNIVAPYPCNHDPRQGGNPGAYRGYISGGTFGVAERCQSYVDPLYPPTPGAPPYYAPPPPSGYPHRPSR